MSSSISQQHQTASSSGNTLQPSSSPSPLYAALGRIASTLKGLVERYPLALLSYIYYHTYYRLYVWYCVYLRAYPIPGGSCAAEGYSQCDGWISHASSSSSSPSSHHRIVSSLGVAPRSLSLLGLGGGGSRGGEGAMYPAGSLQTLLDGSVLAHNTHLTCVRNTVAAPTHSTTAGDGDDGGGFFLVSEEEAEGAHHHPLVSESAAGSAAAAAPSANATSSSSGLIFSCLDEAVVHANRTSMLLVVYMHCEVNAASIALLREVIVHNTNNIQRFLSNNVAFYLMSASSEEASGLNQSLVMGQAFPAVLVFNCNQPVAGDGEAVAADPTASSSSPSSHSSCSSRNGVRFVSSMEGCGCVADLLPYLRECEKRYMSWG